MKLYQVTDPAFAPYGRVLSDLDCAALVKTLEEKTEKPQDSVIYVPSCADMEALPLFEVLQNSFYGGMPTQVGYCNGENTRLNCVEYHRNSEINVPADDIILLVGLECEIEDGQFDSSKIRAFLVPKGTAVELYATTLHYAPCSAEPGAGFRVAIILPRGTNTEKPEVTGSRAEDRWMTARNKWLLAHPDSDEARSGAVVGITGKNLDITDLER